jgi:hypothetical protein
VEGLELEWPRLGWACTEVETRLWFERQDDRSLAGLLVDSCIAKGKISLQERFQRILCMQHHCLVSVLHCDSLFSMVSVCMVFNQPLLPQDQIKGLYG